MLRIPILITSSRNCTPVLNHSTSNHNKFNQRYWNDMIKRHRSGEKMSDLVKENKFSELYPNEPHKASWLVTLHHMTKLHKPSREFVIEVGRNQPNLLVYTFRPIGDQIINRFKSSHPGADIQWTFDKLATLYITNWEYFATKRLKEMEILIKRSRD